MPADDPAVAAGGHGCWPINRATAAGANRPTPMSGPIFAAREPTASQTAWAVLGLLAAGLEDHPATIRGIRYLARRNAATAPGTSPNSPAPAFRACFICAIIIIPFTSRCWRCWRRRRAIRRTESRLKVPRTQPGRGDSDSLTHDPGPLSMRFPFSLTSSLTGYLLKKQLAGQKRFPLVLMLEPLHACNLSCTGCGRIREYADTMQKRMSLDRVSGLGGGMRRADGEHLRRRAALLSANRRTDRENSATRKTHLSLHQRPDAGEAAAGPARRAAVHQRPPRRHGGDARSAGRTRGAFAAAVQGIQAAHAAGFTVCTNTTIYRDTDIHEIAVLFELSDRVGRGRLHDRAGLWISGGPRKPIRPAPSGYS